MGKAVIHRLSKLIISSNKDDKLKNCFSVEESKTISDTISFD